MNPAPRLCRESVIGFTLIELLAALIIAILLVAVVFTTYRTAALVRGGQQARLESAGSLDHALQSLRDDLARAVLPAEDEPCLLALTNGPATRLEFCTMRPEAARADLRFAELWRVSYALDGGRLVRAARPMVGPGALQGPETNELIASVSVFAVELFDGSTWQNAWPSTDARVKPWTARVRIETQGEAPAMEMPVELSIPAGQIVTSALIRTGQVEAP